jgi:hypothetical protein
MTKAQREKAFCIEIQLLGPRKKNRTRDTFRGAGQLFVTKKKAFRAFELALDTLAKVAHPNRTITHLLEG